MWLNSLKKRALQGFAVYYTRNDRDIILVRKREGKKKNEKEGREEFENKIGGFSVRHTIAHQKKKENILKKKKKKIFNQFFLQKFFSLFPSLRFKMVDRFPLFSFLFFFLFYLTLELSIFL